MRLTFVSVVASAMLTSAPPGSVQSPARPTVTGIDHVAFRVSDAAAARTFYRDVLGLTEQPKAARGRIIFSVGSRQKVVLEPGLPAGDDERLSHLALSTTDVKALAAHLTSKGMRVEQPPERCEESAVRVTDPDGHTIELVQIAWPPDPPSPRAEGALSVRLLHAGIIVRDEQGAYPFYRDALGFSEIWRGGRPEGVTQWVNMRVPDGTDYLEFMLAAKPPDRRQRGSMHHLCLVVPDMQAAWEEVARRAARFKHEIRSPPNVGVNGRWQLNLFDPDGTRTELMEPSRIR